MITSISATGLSQLASADFLLTCVEGWNATYLGRAEGSRLSEFAEQKRTGFCKIVLSTHRFASVIVAVRVRRSSQLPPLLILVAEAVAREQLFHLSISTCAR
jgi:hypothetical protein